MIVFRVGTVLIEFLGLWSRKTQLTGPNPENDHVITLILTLKTHH